MTMAPTFMSGMKAAQEVRPMKGGISHLSTEILRSVRGDETLYTPSGSLSLPLRPVRSSIWAVSNCFD